MKRFLKGNNLWLIYALPLLLQVLVIGTRLAKLELRGGLVGEFFLIVSIFGLSVWAIALVWLSGLSKGAKFGLTLLQGPGLVFLGWILSQTALIVLFFGPGVCRTTFNSPSGQRSITVEDACFMGCSHTVYENRFIFERAIGELALNNGRVCDSNAVFTWNADETEVKWKVQNESGTLRLP
jgi:hypothetical protein